MATTETIKMTADQYLQLGEDPPGVRLELVDGAIRVTRSPTVAHAYAISRLLYILVDHTLKNKLGVVMSDSDHVVEEFTVRRPDIFYFSAARVHLIPLAGIRHPPDLAVEVISPGSERIDRKEKFGEYASFGVAHYWLIDPQRRTAEAFRLKRKKYVAAGSARNSGQAQFPPFEDLTLNLPDLWWPPR